MNYPMVKKVILLKLESLVFESSVENQYLLVRPRSEGKRLVIISKHEHKKYLFNERFCPASPNSTYNNTPGYCLVPGVL